MQLSLQSAETGKFLKQARQAKKITQKELAQKLNCHAQFISNWERGLCLPPETMLVPLSKIVSFNRVAFKKLLLSLASKRLNQVL